MKQTGMELVPSPSVSYTHLDVYKRQALVSANGIKDANLIYVGQKIKIPGESTEQGKAVATMRVTAKDGLRLRKVPSTDNNLSLIHI